jgi:hypothetical protein
MKAASFIADMNALQKEFDTLPAEVVRLIETLMELVEVQQGNIETMLAANKTLLGVIDKLKA